MSESGAIQLNVDLPSFDKALTKGASHTRSANPSLAEQMRADADGLRELLVRTIAANHPGRPGDVANVAYQRCRAFLACFNTVYTLNYDLLLYRALMQDDLERYSRRIQVGARWPARQFLELYSGMDNIKLHFASGLDVQLWLK